MGNNLIYNGFRIGCCNTASSGSLVRFTYNYEDTGYACYFANLQPNTTYTIKRIDNSSRFRIATYTTDVKMLKGSGTNDSIVQQWVMDNSNARTFTTGNDDIYLCIYYTNNSEFNTRVMLNEGSSIMTYEDPTLDPPWYWRIINDEFMLPLSIPIIESSFDDPYPKAILKVYSNGTIGNDLANEYSKLSDEPIVPIYPEALLRIDSNLNIYNGLYSKMYDLGAFSHSSNLITITIPRSVKYIGKNCATYSQLTEVRIASDCELCNTSFPENCVIDRY